MVQQTGLLGNFGQNMQRGFGRIGDAITGKDPNARDQLAIALMSLSGNPQQTQALQQLAANRIERRRGENQSVAFLQKQAKGGDRLAEEMLNLIPSLGSGPTIKAYLDVKYGAGSRTPAAFRALDMTARAAGFKPTSEGGSGLYEQFMATGGAGLKAEAKAFGRGQGQERSQKLIDLPKVQDQSAKSLNLINRIIQNNELDGVLGKYEGLIPSESVTASLYFTQDQIDLIGDIDNLENEVFLEAFQTLKGGGQITELEGAKAQRAIVNLSRLRSPDKFKGALRDLAEVISAGLERAKKGITVEDQGEKRFVGNLELNNLPETNSSNPNVTHRYNPQTGKVEPIK